MTTIPSTLARLLAGGCALALTLTACGGSDDAGGTDGAAGGTAPTASAAGGTAAMGEPATTASTDGRADEADDGDEGADDDDGSGKEARWLSPIDEFLGFGVEPSAEQQAEYDQQQRQMEQLITECMTAQGFEYVARDPSTAPPSAGPWDLPQDEFAHQYGYGITTIDRDDVPSNDPNEALLDAMSVPEKQAYYQALYGDVITVDENGELTKRALDAGAAPAADTESCSARASTEVYGDASPKEATGGDAFAPLQEEMSALYERVENDQRVADARTGWASCMADAGYPGFTDVYDASTEVSDRATELTGGSMDLTAADPAALEELRTYEVAVATADLGCRADYDTVHQEAQTEIEQAFIDEHRTELEQYRDAIAAGDVGVG